MANELVICGVEFNPETRKFDWILKSTNGREMSRSPKGYSSAINASKAAETVKRLWGLATVVRVR